MQVEGDVNQAAEGLRGEKYNFTTPFPAGAFGNSLKAAAQVVASQRGKAGVPVITLSLGSFDTHQNQPGAHANLLRQFAEGMAALKGSMTELGAWDRTLVMTFSEFGRRARQNNSNGTDHGTVAPHFVAGGAVRGGVYGQAPDLNRLDATQNALLQHRFSGALCGGRERLVGREPRNHHAREIRTRQVSENLTPGAPSFFNHSSTPKDTFASHYKIHSCLRTD